jgi:hypothetical protein
MRSGLLRMSEADPAAVRTYLASRNMESKIIEWKYFDSHFNRDCERGVVLARENKVAGFLGLIPFCAAKGDFRVECAWSCDWSVDSEQGAGMGLMLVKRARELYDGIFNVGGNENTRHIFPRLADRTVFSAAVNLVLPLRLGSVFAALPSGFLKDSLNRQQVLRQIPLRWIRHRSSCEVSIVPGLAPEIVPLMGDVAPDVWCPSYDFSYVDWQLGRCPAILCWSCWWPAAPPIRTAALIWRSRNSARYWRLAFFGDIADLPAINELTRAIVAFVYSQGAVALFAIASDLERVLVNALAGLGFFSRSRRLPLYILRGRNSQLPADEFGVLSFLDADLAYRFESDSDSNRH